MKKQIIITNKKTGFTAFSREMRMRVLCDYPVTLNEGKHHELIATVRGDDRKMYSVEPGEVDEKTNEMCHVYLYRKSLDVTGSILLNVVIEFYDKSLKEVQEEAKRDSDLAKRGASIFLDRENVPKKSLEELTSEIDELLKDKKGHKPPPRWPGDGGFG